MPNASLLSSLVRQLMQHLIPLSSTLVTALITSLLTVRLSLKQFRSEHWWERQLQTYTDIVDTLTALDDVFGTYLRAFDRNVQLSEARKRSLDEQGALNWAKLRRLSAAGAFLISSKAHQAIENVVADIDPNQELDGYTRIQEERSGIRVCLETLRAEAKRDLR